MSRMWTEETERLFVAADLPKDVRDAIAEWQRTQIEAREGVRVNNSLHLTLAFLGDVPKRRTPEVAEALAGVDVPKARVLVGEPLFLPRRSRPQVIALSLLDADGDLTRLQAGVSDALSDAGVYKPERRRWLPHMTVARFRRDGHPFSLQNVNVEEFCVVRMVLYSSLLERTGAVHVPVADFPAS